MAAAQLVVSKYDREDLARSKKFGDDGSVPRDCRCLYCLQDAEANQYSGSKDLVLDSIRGVVGYGLRISDSLYMYLGICTFRQRNTIPF